MSSYTPGTERSDTTTVDTATSASPPAVGRTPTGTWVTVLTALTGLIAVGDILFMALIAVVIPPLAAGAALTLAGIALLRRRPKAGIAILGLTSLVLGVTAIAFLGPHLAHPSSPVDFLHAALGIAGRALAVAAAAGAWRGAATSGARRLAATALGLAAITIAISAVASLAAGSDTAQPGDIPVAITGSQFPDTVTVDAGQTLHLDNQDLSRHTFTVADTDLDIDLPAGTAARATVDLPTGTYTVICDIPGHEHMTSQLTVS